MKWFSYKAGPTPDTLEEDLLAAATSTGDVELLRYNAAEKGLNVFKNLNLNPRRALCLSLDWSSRNAKGQAAKADPKLIVSQSDGTLAYLPSIDGFENESTSTLSAPELAEGEDDEDDEDLVASFNTLNNSKAWTDAGKSQPRGLETWKAHNNEAWIAAWDCWTNGTVAWSGADDLTLKGWDVRTPVRRTGRDPTFVTRKG